MRKFGVTAASRRVGLIGSVAVAAAAVGTATLAAPAVAASPHVVSTELDSSYATVTSSTGHKLQVEVDAFVQPSAPSDGVAIVTLSRAIGKGGNDGEEDHTWMLPIKASDLSATSAGKGALHLSAKELSRFGAIRLTMAPTGAAKTQNCGGAAAASIQHVKVSGTFYFASRSTGADKWGSVGSDNAKRTFHFPGKSELIRYFAGGDKCLNNQDGGLGALPCMTMTMWDANSGDADISGFELLGTEIVTGSRMVSLPAPAGAVREDDVVGPMAAPTLSVSTPAVPPVLGAVDATLTVAPGKSAISSGVATIISSAAEAPQTVPCGSGQSESATGWGGSTYVNAPANPLTLTSQVFNGIHVANNSNATVMDFRPTSLTPTPTSTPTASQPSIDRAHVATAAASNAVDPLSYVERLVASRHLQLLHR